MDWKLWVLFNEEPWANLINFSVIILEEKSRILKIYLHDVFKKLYYFFESRAQKTPQT